MKRPTSICSIIPPLPGWEERSQFIRQEGKLSFHHYDFYAQALSKIERGHDQDHQDFIQMIDTGLVNPDRLVDLFYSIENELYRYPDLDRNSFRQAVELAVAAAKVRLRKPE